MNRRIILKTVLICTGLFIIVSALGIFYLFQRYEFDTEKKYKVITASKNIEQGMPLNESMVVYKTIKESALTPYMITDMKNIQDTKVLVRVDAGDYIRSYDLLAKDKWYTDEERVIVLPMDVEDRIAGLIKKGSLIDIRVALKTVKSSPKTVLSKVRVEDIVDESGISISDSAAGKKVYAKFVFNENQRNKIYIAREVGKLIYELYCDSEQKPSQEEFQIPSEFLNSRY